VSKVTPIFQAGCIVVLSEMMNVGLCTGRPMRKSSVIAGLRDRTLEAIYDEISETTYLFRVDFFPKKNLLK